MVVALPISCPPYNALLLQLLKSNPASDPVPVLGKGEPATTNREPSALMVNMETPLVSASARNWPLAEIFMLSRGVQQLVAVKIWVSAPVAAMLQVLIWPLLEAIRN